MANGVVCPHCKSELEGKVKRGDIVDCPECNRRFNITVADLDNYKKLQVKPVAVTVASHETVAEPVKQKKKMPTWAILLIAFFGLGLLGNIVGALGKKDKAPEQVSTPVAPQTDAEKLKANNDKVLAEAQAEYNKTHKVDDNQTSVKPITSVSTERKPMDFAECQKKQAEIIYAAQGTPTKVLTVINSDVFTSIRVCTTDGSMLIGCDKLDQQIVMTKSPHRTDCE